MKYIELMLRVFRFIKRKLIMYKYSSLIFFQKESLENFLEKSRATILIFTHEWGGGTEQYVINNYYKEECLIVRKKIYSGKDKHFSIEDVARKKIIYINKKDLQKLFCKRYKSLIVNSLCTYSDVHKILESSVKAKNENPHMYLSYMVHDFHCICPNYTLFADGFYCYLQCKKHNCKFGKFYPSVTDWRREWLSFLEKTDEIRCFSESSKEILIEAYPTIKRDKISVVPHDISFLKFTPIKNKSKGLLVLGIVGACQHEIKGNKVLQTILKEIPETVRFVFVGTKEHQLKTKRKNVVFLGKYKHDELQIILEKEKITHVIFPSVVPETFSYVVSEIIQMELPIICFKIGAQAEKVSKYEKGIVCENVREMIEKIKLYIPQL